MNNSGVVNIKGKEYQTVAKRIKDFKDAYSEGYSIVTEIIKSDHDAVVMKASIVKEDKVLSTGYAEEIRGSSNINKSSALENAETSAVGRALAFFGMGGTEIASANEVSNAIVNQARIEASEEMISYMSNVRDLFPSIAYIKNAIQNYIETGEGLDVAAEGWHELTNEEKTKVWKAPSKGGIFTTKEREVLKSDEMSKVYREGSSGVVNIEVKR